MSDPNRDDAGLSTPDTIRAGQDRIVPCVNVGAVHPQNGGTGPSLAASVPDRGHVMDRSALRSPIASVAHCVRSEPSGQPLDLQSP
jgi:hypothetical protein